MITMQEDMFNVQRFVYFRAFELFFFVGLFCFSPYLISSSFAPHLKMGAAHTTIQTVILRFCFLLPVLSFSIFYGPLLLFHVNCVHLSFIAFTWNTIPARNKVM